ncbi:uncharacterized protein LOC132305508 [Cornus florida]|uniref:uncharacterized protein LOC132305508 n=1 Tax=Cornus florida TaxID=4283 RepID=UPI00289ABD2B|nr:uncharacterized protein LOC132305508 [Cornus florida]
MVTTINQKHHWARMSPALYATPEPTPLPDSPTSFPPSPYIINHKRRGPRLLKSFSEVGVATCKQAVDERDVSENVNNPEKEVADKTNDVTFTVAVPSPVEEEHVNGSYDGVLGRSDLALTSAKSNTEAESNNGVGVEQSLNLTPPIPEFFDAWEELSSENGPQASLPDVEEELREIRLSLVLEIEKRKQAEETLKYMQSRWLRIREQLSLVGLTLADPIDVVENEKLQVDPAEDLSQQVHIARFVSNIIGRGTARYVGLERYWNIVRQLPKFLDRCPNQSSLLQKQKLTEIRLQHGWVGSGGCQSWTLGSTRELTLLIQALYSPTLSLSYYVWLGTKISTRFCFEDSGEWIVAMELEENESLDDTASEATKEEKALVGVGFCFCCYYTWHGYLSMITYMGDIRYGNGGKWQWTWLAAIVSLHNTARFQVSRPGRDLVKKRCLQRRGLWSTHPTACLREVVSDASDSSPLRSIRHLWSTVWSCC